MPVAVVILGVEALVVLEPSTDAVAKEDLYLSAFLAASVEMALDELAASSVEANFVVTIELLEVSAAEAKVVVASAVPVEVSVLEFSVVAEATSKMLDEFTASPEAEAEAEEEVAEEGVGMVAYSAASDTLEATSGAFSEWVLLETTLLAELEAEVVTEVRASEEAPDLTAASDALVAPVTRLEESIAKPAPTMVS